MGDWLDGNMNWFGWVVGAVVALIFVVVIDGRKVPIWKQFVVLVIIAVGIGIGLGIVADLVD